MRYQFKAGDGGNSGGVHWRVRHGEKTARREGEADLVFELRCPTWTPVKMELVAAAMVMLAENEDRLYPPEQGFLGRGKLWRYFRKSITWSWQGATAELNAERVRAEARRSAL